MWKEKTETAERKYMEAINEFKEKPFARSLSLKWQSIKAGNKKEQEDDNKVEVVL